MTTQSPGADSPDTAPAVAPLAPAPAPAPVPTAKRRSRLPYVLLAFVIVAPMAMCAPLLLMSRPSDVPDAVVLELDLEQGLPEPGGAVGLFGEQAGPTLRDVVLGLAAAAKDERVKGLLVRVGGTVGGQATVQELRDALAVFRASGKPVFTFSEGFGELSPGTGGYVVAVASDEIWLQPAGMVSLTGPFAESPFLKGALEKLGVKPEFAARKEYKNAVNMFTEDDYTAAHKEATLALVTGLLEQATAAIAADRPALGDEAAVRALLLGGPWDATTALARGLVDHLGHRDEAHAAFAVRLGLPSDEPLPLLWVHRYLARKKPPAASKQAPVVGVVTAVGQIHRGKSNNDPFSGTRTVGSDTTAHALRQAIDDDEVKAILLRVDSPGGSVVASEAIWREVERAKAAKKPVVISMGNVAASGGYYISMGADAIVAQPGTITGSIGVYAGKMELTGLWGKLGVRFVGLSAPGADPSFFSPNEPYSEAARERLNEVVDGIYSSFVAKVAAGRNSSVEVMEPLARGRVWLGAAAHTHGLVDHLGGYRQAFFIVKEKLGLGPDDVIRLRDFPAKKPPWQEVLALLGGETGDSSNDVAAHLPTARARIDAAAAAGFLQRVVAQEGPVQLLLPPTEVLP
jgi:protease IV